MKHGVALHLLHIVSIGATFSTQLAMLASVQEVASLVNQLLSWPSPRPAGAPVAANRREKLLLLSAGYATLSGCAVALCIILPNDKHVLHSLVPPRWVSPYSLAPLHRPAGIHGGEVRGRDGVPRLRDFGVHFDSRVFAEACKLVAIAFAAAPD